MDRKKGFSLIELMIVIAIVALLIALAVPSYTAWVLKANRGDAQAMLINWANNQEIWRSGDTDYASDSELVPPSHEFFTFAISNRGVSTYTLTATAKSGTKQENDKERGADCSAMTLDQSGNKGPAKCWQDSGS